MMEWGMYADWRIIEGIVGVIWIYSVFWAWRKAVAPDSAVQLGERELAATVILAQLNGVITAAAIIMAGLGAAVALTSPDVKPDVSLHLYYAAMWSMLTLGIAVYTVSILPTRTISTNFVCSRWVAIGCSTARSSVRWRQA